jgi:hypothetical protein
MRRKPQGVTAPEKIFGQRIFLEEDSRARITTSREIGDFTLAGSFSAFVQDRGVPACETWA